MLAPHAVNRTVPLPRSPHRTAPPCGRRRTRRAAISAVALAATAAFTLGACSTSGRELREPSFSAPVLALAATASTEPSSSLLIERLDGFALSSPELAAGGALPVEAGALAGNRSPALVWTATPSAASELALVVSDPSGTNVYWLVTGIAPEDAAIAPGDTPAGGVVRPNSAGNTGYDGPVVVTGATASVLFRVYALREPLELDPELPAEDAVRAIAEASFATATMSAVYTDDATARAGE